MWFFRCPQIIFGPESLDYLAEIPAKRALLVTDAALVKLGLVDLVTRKLDAAGVAYHIFDEVTAEPTLELALHAAEVARQVQPDLIIGLGGGSAMDTAKTVRILYERPDLPVDGISPLETLNLSSDIRLVTIPTTSGTGADAGWGVVLTDKASHRKLVLGSPEGLPDFAIVDPVFTMNLPPSITRDTGMDVLAHSIECFVGGWRNDFTDGLMVKSTELVFQYLTRACKNPADAEAREHMHNAATIAGLGLGNAQIGICHSMAHALGGMFHAPHGQLIGICLPYTLEFAANTVPENLASLARYLGLSADPGKEGAFALVKAVRDLAAETGHPASLKEIGLAEDAFRKSLSAVMENASQDPCSITSPRIPESEEFNELFWCVYHGKLVTF
jgi:alcohol dehydrogenase class IV